MTRFKNVIMPPADRCRTDSNKYGFIFSSRLEDWHPKPKRNPPSLKKGLEAVRMKGMNSFRAANDNLILWR